MNKRVKIVATLGPAVELRGGKKFGEKKFGGRGKSFGKDKPDFKKRKLAPGVEFVDRELGVGIVRKLTDDGIVVAFGDAEKTKLAAERIKTAIKAL